MSGNNSSATCVEFEERPQKNPKASKHRQAKDANGLPNNWKKDMRISVNQHAVSIDT